MEQCVHYNGHETNDFGTLALWFQELKKENERLKEANEQHRDDYIRLKLGYDEFKQRNRDLEEENKNLKTERSNTEEVLKRYCGDSVDAPISTMVGLIIDDYFYQKAETECQVKELQKAEKTIDKLNTELVVYADKVAVQGKWITELEEELKIDDKMVAYQRGQIRELEEKLKNWEKKLWDPDWCRLIDKLNEMIDKEAPIICQLRKVYTNVEDEIWDKLNYLTRSLCFRNSLIREKDKDIRKLENKVNDLDVANRRLKLENEKLILVHGNNAVEHAAEIIDLKKEISALNAELEERKNKRSPRWPSDVMRICVLENKVNELTNENNRLKYSQPWMYGMSSKEAANRIFGVNGTIHKLREENDKLKDALEFCQKEASSARAHAHNVEVNAERIRKELD